MYIKPGFQTTEFWLTAVQLVVSALALFGILDPPAAVSAAAVVGGGAAVGGYAIGRGAAKRPPR